MSIKYKSVLEAIGNTPTIELNNIYKGPGKLIAKMEFIQPGGSVKDRAAKKIIELAYKNGKLKNGQPVVEMTSGNMGTGLAVICNVTGNPFIAVMSKGNSSARALMLRNLGAEVVFTEQIDGIKGQVTGNDINAAVNEALKITNEKKAFYVDQFNNEGSLLAHFEGTGPEIWDDFKYDLTAFVACVGSGGTFLGTSKYLKSKNSKIICAAVEPEGSQILAGEMIIKPKHILQGTGYGLIPPHWDKRLADKFLCVSDNEAEEFKKRLALEEGIYVGYSAAANVCASLKLINSGLLGDSPMVVTILCDTGLKY